MSRGAGLPITTAAGSFTTTRGRGGRDLSTDTLATIQCGRRRMSPSLVSEAAALDSAWDSDSAGMGGTVGCRSGRVTGITRGTADGVAARILWASEMSTTSMTASGRSAEIAGGSSRILTGAIRNDRVRGGISSMGANEFGRGAVSAHQENISAASFRSGESGERQDAGQSVAGKLQPVRTQRQSFDDSQRASGFAAFLQRSVAERRCERRATTTERAINRLLIGNRTRWRLSVE